MKFLIAMLLSMVTVFAYAEWVPPLAPNVADILREAQADTKAKRYVDALAKHVWLYQHALKYAPELNTIQFASEINSWQQLGKAYKPALLKLRVVRDEAAISVKEGFNERKMFQSFVAINREFREENKSKDLFVWLNDNNPELAHQVYPLAQRPLVIAKEYKVCGKYINPEKDYQRLVENYHRDLALAKGPAFGKELQKFGEKSFSNGVTILIALLVVNKRLSEAEMIATSAKREWDNPGFHKEIKKALAGKVPKPWLR